MFQNELKRKKEVQKIKEIKIVKLLEESKMNVILDSIIYIIILNII
jgi:hypothetical protein